MRRDKSQKDRYEAVPPSVDGHQFRRSEAPSD